MRRILGMGWDGVVVGWSRANLEDQEQQASKEDREQKQQTERGSRFLGRVDQPEQGS
jgi:hypothetical protein